MFHITITNKDDGKVLVDKDTVAIVAGLGGSFKDDGVVAMAQGELLEIGVACHNAIEAGKVFRIRFPELNILLPMLETIGANGNIENTIADYEAKIKAEKGGN